MADIHFQTDDSTNKAATVDCGKPQQESGCARLAVVAPPDSCGSAKLAITPSRILRLPEVIARVGLRRSSIYLHMTMEKFPKPISLGPRAVGWLEHEIDAWLEVRIQARKLSKK